MRGAERVVFALGALGEAGQPAALAQRADAVAPAGQNLVGIGLMADVPDQTVVRRVEDVMQRDRKLDDAQPGAEMPARDRDGIDRLLPQFVGDLAQLAGLEAAQVARYFDLVEQRRFRFNGHANLRVFWPYGREAQSLLLARSLLFSDACMPSPRLHTQNS